MNIFVLKNKLRSRITYVNYVFKHKNKIICSYYILFTTQIIRILNKNVEILNTEVDIIILFLIYCIINDVTNFYVNYIIAMLKLLWTHTIRYIYAYADHVELTSF